MGMSVRVACLVVSGAFIAAASEREPAPRHAAPLREDVMFSSGNAKLAGSFVIPASGEVRAGVIFVHGSGEQRRPIRIAQRFARDGIAAFVYDKRGVGESGGEYEADQAVAESNLRLLAQDARAAFDTLASHPRLEGVPLGMTGISQAGWIVPLAAAGADDVDFLALWSGPVCKVSEEDLFSKHTRDLDGGAVPSYESAVEARTSPYVWPEFLGRDTDAAEDLAKLDVPGLWVFGAQDGSVPVDLSTTNLVGLARSHEYEYVLFSRLGHNNMQESFATVSDWIMRR